MYLPIRKSPRRKEYDYSSEWCYFVTIVTKDREYYFGEIMDEKMILNNLGKQAYNSWNQILKFHPYVEIDEFVCMPNHIHGILHIVGTDYIRPQKNDDREDAWCNNLRNPDACNASLHCKSWSLGSIIRNMKSRVTKYANTHNISFARQWRYHDHIIRNEKEYEKIEYYIQNNPQNRKKDRFS